MEFLSITTPDAAKNRLQAEMERFGRDKNQPVSLSQVEWKNLWRELVNVGIYRRGPDLAEIGSTWLESLVKMECLRSFSADEINGIGGKEVFFPAAWQNTAIVDRIEIWGIPFRADARVVFYWKDIFENASIDAPLAFSTPENMTAAFEKLQEMGISPWVVPTDNSTNTAANIASWVWDAGGDFISPDGRRTDFGSEATQRGMLAYFDLFRFMPRHAYPITDSDTTELFFTRQAAATVAGPWYIDILRQRNDGDKLLPHLGVALLPGPAFVGGTTLVIWKHCKDPSTAIEFIGRLISPEFNLEHCQLSGSLPMRQDLWTDEFINSHDYLPVFNQAIRTGRGLPPVALWGLIGDRLSKTLAYIWENLYLMDAARKPQEITRQMIAKHLVSLSAYLDTSLK